MTESTPLCQAEKSILLIIDIQSKLTATMADSDVSAMVQNSGRLLESAAILSLPVFVTEQYPKGLGPTAPEVQVKLPKDTRVFDKTGFSCCAAEGFTQALTQSGRTQIILVGMETHVCVLQTALDLKQKGFQVFVVEDAVSSRANEHKLNALERMRLAGVTLTNHESVMFEWLRSSSHTDFKEISGLLK